MKKKAELNVLKKSPVKRALFCDLGRIQTCNRLSRNQVFYSVELRGQNRLQTYKRFILLNKKKQFFNHPFFLLI